MKRKSFKQLIDKLGKEKVDNIAKNVLSQELYGPQILLEKQEINSLKPSSEGFFVLGKFSFSSPFWGRISFKSQFRNCT